MRSGYRVLQLRNKLGTRIKYCYLFVKISLGEEAHRWASSIELRKQNDAYQAKLQAAQRVASLPLVASALKAIKCSPHSQEK